VHYQVTMDNSFENSVDNPDWVNYGHAVGNCGRPDIDVSPTPGSGDMKMSAPMLDTQTSAFGACADNQTQDDLYSASPPRQYSVYGTNRPVHGSTSTKDSGEQLNSQQAPPTIGGSYEGLPTMQGIQEDTPMPHHKPSILDLLPHDPMSNPTGKKGPINTMLEKKHKSSKATPSLSGTNNLNSEAESSNSQKRHSDSQVVIDDPAHVDAAMRDGEEDHSWMNEGQDSDDEYEELLGTVNKLKRRQLNGKITEAQRVDLYKLQKHLTLKQRLRDMAKAKDDEEESLFVPETREDVVRRHSMGVPAMQESQPPLDGDEEHDLFGENPNWADKKPEKNVKKPAFPGATQDQPEDEDAGFMAMMQQEIDGTGLDGIPSEKELNKRKKPRKKAAKNAREFYEREREVKERKKQKKEKGRQPAAKAHAGGKTAAKGGKASKKGNESVKVNKGMVKNNESLLRSQGYNRNDGMDDVAQMIIQDLINHDPITDRITDPIFDVSPEEEISGANNKATQLQRLFANIPQGSNTSKAKSDKAQLLQASRSFGYAKVRAVDGKWLVKGMKSTLYHHQLLGANWMLQRELNGGAPFGGLLADSMGLGKTVQTLACMVGNPAQEDDRKRGISSRATLIVVPSAVIDQWMDEIRYHAEESAFPKIMHYRAKNKIPRAVLEDLDVVVTSYNEVMRQFPFPNHKDRVEIGKMGYNEWWKKVVESQLGDLHSIHWYRVVLDEAQAIKNNSARTSLACQALKSVYRWCLTGTPLLNRLEE
jgi:SNF2 family DNA or RNA helicase